MFLNSVAVNALSYIIYSFILRSFSVFVAETFMAIYFEKNSSPYIFSKPQERDVIYNNFISFLVSVNHSLLFRGMAWNLDGKYVI